MGSGVKDATGHSSGADIKESGESVCMYEHYAVRKCVCSKAVFACSLGRAQF